MPVAVISVADKRGIEKWQALLTQGWTVYASDGSLRALEGHRCTGDMRNIAEIATIEQRAALTRAGVQEEDHHKYVDGEPLGGHSVVSISRPYSATLLLDRENEAHRAEIEARGLAFTDLVVCITYRFNDQLAKKRAKGEEATAIEDFDVGGPLMILSAVKRNVLVVTDIADYDRVIEAIITDSVTDELRRELRMKALASVMRGHLDVARWMFDGELDGVVLEKVRDLDYGENPHQQSKLMTENTGDACDISQLRKVGGREASHNNFIDIDACSRYMARVTAVLAINGYEDETPCRAVATKHGNAAGLAVGGDKYEVTGKMICGHYRDVFGGVLMLNYEVDEQVADIILNTRGPRKIDSIVAPSFTEGALKCFNRPEGKCRRFVMDVNALRVETGSRLRQLRGGAWLMQDANAHVRDLRNPDGDMIFPEQRLDRLGEMDLLLAEAIMQESKSNTIVAVTEGMLVALAVGQQSRVGAVDLLIQRAASAGHWLRGAVVGSDAFFTEKDAAMKIAAESPLAILTVRGAKKDDEIFGILRAAGIPLYTTERRAFEH